MNHDDLRKLAQKAGGGEWVVDPDDRPGMEWNNHILDALTLNAICFMSHSGGKEPECDEAKAQYIAAANPARILAILDELDALRKDAERYAHFIASSPNEEICFMGDTHFGKPALDAAIDAAIEKGGAA